MKKGNGFRIVMFIVGVLFVSCCLMLAVLGTVIYEQTLIDWWIPVVVAVGAAVLLAYPMGRVWGWLSGFSIGWLNRAFGFLIVGALSCFGFLAVNSWCGDGSSGYETRAVVAEKRQSVHSRSHRAGRHRYASRGSCYKYHFLLRFEDGTLKEMEVNSKEYMKAKLHGDSLTVVMHQGCFGFPVVDEIKPLPSSAKSDRKPRRGMVGRR